MTGDAEGRDVALPNGGSMEHPSLPHAADAVAGKEETVVGDGADAERTEAVLSSAGTPDGSADAADDATGDVDVDVDMDGNRDNRDNERQLQQQIRTQQAQIKADAQVVARQALAEAQQEVDAEIETASETQLAGIQEQAEAERKRIEEQARQRAQLLAQRQDEQTRAAIERTARDRAAQERLRKQQELRQAEEREIRLQQEAERLAVDKQSNRDDAHAVEPANEDSDGDGYLAPPRSFTGMTFANAFGNNPQAPKSVTTPRDSKKDNDSFTTPVVESSTPTTAPMSNDSSLSNAVLVAHDPANADDSETSSMTALGARNKKRVSGRMHAYLEQARKNKPAELPPDKGSMPTSPVHSRKLIFDASNQSQAERRKSADATTRSKTPIEGRRSSIDISSIRARFNKAAEKSNTPFVYGEAFRKQQKLAREAEKMKDKEAVSVARGFNVMMLEAGKAQMGEVDESNLDKTFVFQSGDVRLHDGECKVDYANNLYESYVFLVHRTRGLLLLKQLVDPNSPRYVVPGGRVIESEFLSAAKLTGHESVQLQLAAREGAARELYQATGIDVRAKLERMKPAVLRREAADVDGGNEEALKNEKDNKLYFFLQVEENDFPTEAVEGKTLRGPVDEPGVTNSALKLLLDDDFVGFRFAREPQDAASLLEGHNDGKSSIALSLVMNQASDTPVPEAQVHPSAKVVPDEVGGEDRVERNSGMSQESALARAQEKFDAIQNEEKKRAKASLSSSRALGDGVGDPSRERKKTNLSYEQVGGEAGACCGCVVQ